MKAPGWRPGCIPEGRRPSAFKSSTDSPMKSLFALLIFAVPAFAADPVRVACVGDSITHGVGAGTGGAWPDQLDRMLDAAFDVRGFGHSGATVGKADKHSYWTQKEYKNALAFRPDVVVLM